MAFLREWASTHVPQKGLGQTFPEYLLRCRCAGGCQVTILQGDILVVDDIVIVHILPSWTFPAHGNVLRGLSDALDL